MRAAPQRARDQALRSALLLNLSIFSQARVAFCTRRNHFRDQKMVMAHVHGWLCFRLGLQILCAAGQSTIFFDVGSPYAPLVRPRGNRQVVQ